jgi:hypothetical protein
VWKLLELFTRGRKGWTSSWQQQHTAHQNPLLNANAYRPFKYVQLLTWHCTLMYLNCGCVSFCNTKTTVTILTATLPSLWCTLLLHVADWYVGCINCVSTAEFNTGTTYARSRDNCWHRKAISITYSVCVSVAFVIQHARCTFSVLYYIVFHGLSGATVFFHITSKRHKFRKIFVENKMCVLNFFCLKHFSSWEEFSAILS